MKSDPYSIARKIIMGALTMNFFCILLKVYLYLITLSLAVLAYVIDTVMDVTNDVIALYGTRIASKPPDIDHPYGHGKYDAFISVFIASAIIVSSIEIFRETINRVLFGTEEVYFTSTALQIFIILTIMYLALALIEYYFAKKLKVAIMESSAWHYITDPLYTLMVLMSVYLASVGLTIIDIIASIAIGIMILVGGIRIIKRQSVILLDATAIPSKEIRELILKNFPEVVDVHNIKSRSDGIRTYIEFHIVLADETPLIKAHDLCDEIEKFIKKKYTETPLEITIHAEPVSHIKSDN